MLSHILGNCTAFADATFGVFSFIPNILYKFGWNPGDRLMKHFDKVIAKKTGIADITFRQVNILQHCIVLDRSICQWDFVTVVLLQ